MRNQSLKKASAREPNDSEGERQKLHLKNKDKNTDYTTPQTLTKKSSEELRAKLDELPSNSRFLSASTGGT